MAGWLVGSWLVAGWLVCGWLAGEWLVGWLVAGWLVGGWLACCWLHCNENPIYVFPEKELRGLSPNYDNHVPVSDLYISPGSVHIFPAAE